ncbi:hypothetical protein [Aestuariibaculum marinum]|nr:hypothetical protein [Aestuariibaculum marinum]
MKHTITEIMNLLTQNMSTTHPFSSKGYTTIFGTTTIITTPWGY